MASESALKRQYPLRALFAVTAWCALFFASINLGVALGILMWIIMWNLGSLVGISTAFYFGTRLSFKTAVLSSSIGSAFAAPIEFLFFFFVDGMEESLRQFLESPFLFTVMLPFTGIVGFGYGGLVGVFSYVVFRANRMETVEGPQHTAVERLVQKLDRNEQSEFTSQKVG